MRRKPNYYAVRYYQYDIAGRIAVSIGYIIPYDDAGNILPIYRTNEGALHYSVIGQDYLRMLKLKVTEL
jgi:hypothetical protein